MITIIKVFTLAVIIRRALIAVQARQREGDVIPSSFSGKADAKF